MKTIAILGGMSHIAKGLLDCFVREKQNHIIWFGRSSASMKAFAEHLGTSLIDIREGYDDFLGIKADVIINCIGAGTPNKLNGNYSLWFSVLEPFDNLCLQYLTSVKKDALYITFSSGAIYGREQGQLIINPNAMTPPDYYTITRLYSEAKHRSMHDCNIADIRIFSYFSHFADYESGYFLTDVMKALKSGRPLQTTCSDMTRDYIIPHDLSQLINCIIKQKHINKAIDAYSKAPVKKSKIIEIIQKHFNMQIQYVDSQTSTSPNKTNDIYIPKNKEAAFLGYSPQFTSAEGIIHECKKAIY